MSDTTEELGVRLSLQQKQQLLQGMTEVRRSLKGIGDEAVTSGDKAQRSAGRWTSLQSKVDNFSGAMSRSKRVGGALFGVLVANSNGALGPIGEVANKLNGVGSALEDSRSKAGKWAIGFGAAMTGTGAVLGTIVSKEDTARDQLKSAIESAGGNYEDFRKQIEKNVKTGEHYGDTAARTMSVLNRLVLATHNPRDAFKTFNSVLQIAAARHIDVESAALMVGRAMNGYGRSLQAFGIHVVPVTKLQTDLKNATNEHKTAIENAAKAQQHLQDVQAKLTEAQKKGGTSSLRLAEAHLSIEHATVAANKARAKYGTGSGNFLLAQQKLSIEQAKYNQLISDGGKKGGLTLAQQIELRDAQQQLAGAQQKVLDTTKKQNDAQTTLNKTGSNADQLNHQVAQYMGGQASAAANTFTGHMRALAAVLDDKLAAGGEHVYKFLTIAGPAMMGLGAIIETGFIPKAGRMILKITGIQKAIDLMTASEVAMGDAASVSGAEVEASTATMSSGGIKNMSRLGAAVAGVALAIGTYKVATSTSGAKGAVASSLMGAAAGAAIGFSVGGPLGAAVGGAAGLFGGLAVNIWHSAGALDAANKAMQIWMTTAYQADQFAIGQQFNQGILKNLQSNPALTAILASAGVKLPDIAAAVRSGNAIGGPAGTILQNARRAGKISQKDYQTALTSLQQFVDNFTGVADNLDNLATISGKVSQHTSDVLKSTTAFLNQVYAQPSPGTSSTYTPPTLGSLLTPPTRHTGGYNAFDAYINMKPGEEVVNLPGGTTVVPISQTDMMSMFGNQGDIIVPVTLTLDGQIVAESTHRQTRNKAARL